jgi:hypothetical protein
MSSGERRALVIAACIVLGLLSVPFAMLHGSMGGDTDAARAAAEAAAAAERARREAMAASRIGDGAEAGVRRGSELRAGSASDAEAERRRATARGRAAGALAVDATPPAATVDFALSNRDPSFAERAKELDERDLRCLDQIIAENRLTEDSSGFDYDNGDGVLTATELGLQRYCDGRLRELRLGPNAYATFGYRVARLPECVADLDRLIVLEVNAVGLQELPRAVGRMTDLRRVAAAGNALTSVPVELADAPALRELELSENRLAELPSEVAARSDLDILTLASNPLREVPERVTRQQEAMMRGELRIPERDLGPLDASCRPPG